MYIFFKKLAHHFQNGSCTFVAKNLFLAFVRTVGRYGHIIKRDIGNRFFYGTEAPTFCERIWVDATKVDWYITNQEIIRVTGEHRNLASGRVVDWSKLKEFKPLRNESKIDFCYRHWDEGHSWDELGYYEYMSRAHRHRNDTRQTIIDRFAMLDHAFEQSRATGTLQTRSELDPSSFREESGVLIHIGENGVPYFGGNGFHRMAIAKILNLKRFPACIGVVDRAAIPLLNRYRS
ncbi:hypothetical protein [Desulfonatronum thiodismutans]|uniref:hypothetical protein n=1 Tax=Desulfonatronum thiodismutans TaxID=159290 RepID=UPI00068EE0D3|nr:hypothetical protein [Desulfonatronum thiodismutans]